MDEANELADALRAAARRERERTPGFGLGTVEGEPAGGLAQVRAGARQHAMTEVGDMGLSSGNAGETVLYLSGPMPVVLGRSPYYRGND